MVRFYKIDDAWAFVNGKEGPALWVVSGIHGEEPAPTLAVIQALGQLTSTWGELQFNAPVVVIPVANPSGWATGVRLGKREPLNTSAIDDLTWRNDVSDLALKFPPKLVLDLHEDDMAKEGGLYLYHHGKNEKLPLYLLDFLKKRGFSVWAPLDTRFGEHSDNGIIAGVDDRSFDDFLYRSYDAEVIVLETPSLFWPLDLRVRCHYTALKGLPTLWSMANQI